MEAQSNTPGGAPFFLPLFYLLRARGLDVSLNEWLTLMDALKLGLHGSTMQGFYQLCQAVLCKSETELDPFQQAFLEYFYEQNHCQREDGLQTEVTDELLEWINHPAPLIRQRFTRENVTQAQLNRSREQVEQMLAQRIREQKDQHNGGNYWVGTRGISHFGNNGFNPRGIRVGGMGKNGTAIRIANRREFHDFRSDNVLDIRQFQMAFRLLRQYAQLEGAEEEFDVHQTIRATCDKGGMLQIRYQKPRRNQIKVLLLMDSGGSMYKHSRLCSQFFQAASCANRFQDFQVYYFHNCPNQQLYTHPSLMEQYARPTLEILRRCDGDYRVILVGDALMDPCDITYPPPFGTTNENLGLTGEGWLRLLAKRYRHLVWLNPVRPVDGGAPFCFSDLTSYEIIDSIFPMYRLSMDGLTQAMRKLMASHSF